MEDSSWYSDALLNPGQSRYFETADARLHYLDRHGPRADSPVIILLHGYRAHARWWDFIAPQLCATHRVIALDARGMGDSANARSYKTGDFINDLDLFIGHLGLASVTVVGHSWSGYHLLRLCAQRPALIKHAIVVDSFFKVPIDEPLPRPPPFAMTKIYDSKDQAVQRFRLSPPQPVRIPAIQEHIANVSFRQEGGGWRRKHDPLLPVPSADDPGGDVFLFQIESRVDVVHCESSPLVSLNRASATAAFLRHGRGPIVLPAAYHHPMLDQPLVLVAALRALLA